MTEEPLKTHELLAGYPTPLALRPLAKAATQAWGGPTIAGTTQRWTFALPTELSLGPAYLRLEDHPGGEGLRLVASNSIAGWLTESGRPGSPVVLQGRPPCLAFVRTLPLRLTLFGQQLVLRRVANLTRGQPVAVAPAPIRPDPPAVAVAREAAQGDADRGAGLAEERGQLSGRRSRRGHR